MGPTFESKILVCAIDDPIFFSVDSLPNLPDMLTLTDVDSGDSTVMGVMGWNPSAPRWGLR
jgi:hypothetical protein